MDRIDMLLRAVGRIEGKMEEIPDLSRRVSNLEMWQSWLKGGWAAVVAMYIYVCRALHWKTLVFLAIAPLLLVTPACAKHYTVHPGAFRTRQVSPSTRC